MGTPRAGSIPVVRTIVYESLRVPCWNERRLFVLSERNKKMKKNNLSRLKGILGQSKFNKSLRDYL